MNPQIIFWIAFAVIGICVVYFSVKYDMLKETSIPGRHPYSWSRVQLAWWTVIILSSFTAILFFHQQAPALGTSTVILLGISAATTATARIISVSDSNDPTVHINMQAQQGEGFILDILSDQNGVNISRFQTVVFNFVFGCWFIYAVLNNLLLPPEGNIDAIMPEISNSNLVLLGLSSATYAAIKVSENKTTAAPPPPPAEVNEANNQI